MFNINNTGIIQMNRGDTVEAPLFINKGTELDPLRYVLDASSQVYFAIEQPNQPFEYAIVKKVFTNKDLNSNNDVVIKLSSNDTLQLLPGKYYYEIKLNLYNSISDSYEVNTIIPQKELYII